MPRVVLLVFETTVLVKLSSFLFFKDAALEGLVLSVDREAF